MTNLELIQTTTPELLAAFLHKMQAGAIIEGADSEEGLLEWLNEEVEEDAGGADNG